MSAFAEKNIRSALEIFNNMSERFTWKNRDSRYVLMDDQTAQLCGFESSDISFEGITDFDLKCDSSEYANEFRKADMLVIRKKQEISGMSFCRYKDSEWRLLIGRSSPFFGENGDVIGVKTITIDVTDCIMMRGFYSLFLAENKLLESGQDNGNQVFCIFKNHYEDFGLTNRQSEVLFLIVRGYTAKEIARIIKIDFRTVQNHTAEIKARMGCVNRSEVISKVLDSGLGNIVPKSLLSLSHHSAYVKKY